MDCKVVFSSNADNELRNSVHWYENRVRGLGDRLIYFIDLTIELIRQDPKRFPNKKGPYREAAVKIFPYQIIYE